MAKDFKNLQLSVFVALVLVHFFDCYCVTPRNPYSRLACTVNYPERPITNNLLCSIGLDRVLSEWFLDLRINHMVLDLLLDALWRYLAVLFQNLLFS